MDSNSHEKLIEDLTLLLLFLTSRQEKDAATGEPLYSSWKSYDWTAMDRLIEEGFIFQPRCRRTHSRTLTPEGVEKAKELLKALSFTNNKK